MTSRPKVAFLTDPGLVMGTVRVEPGLWERYVEAGGMVFDAARHYGDRSEDELGRLIERDGLRDRITLVGKGAHTPYCAPEHVGPQLERSLELLRTGYLDIYLLHRDDPAVPVAEWAECLEPHVEAGRIRSIGASNWTAARYEAFNAHAAAHGTTPFTVLSNQLSLAEMAKPVWDGCLRADTSWHEATGTPLLAWSAQARGFFADRPDDDELRASWISPANVERRRRAGELAAARGVSAQAVALAYVLARPFPVGAVVGPRTQEELDECLAATRVELTVAESGWLDLSTDGGSR